MYKRYYDSYSGTGAKKYGGEVITPQSINHQSDEIKTFGDKNECETSVTACKSSSPFSLPFEIDDLILIGILLFLLFDKNNDDDSDNDPFIFIIIGIILLSDIF